MEEPSAGRPAGRQAGGRSRLQVFWMRIREPLARSRLAKVLLGWLLAQYLRLTKFTNPAVAGSSRLTGAQSGLEPAIITLWHGQHLLAPAIYPSTRPLIAMVSRSADAEINALVLKNFGIEAVRGSGGRDARNHAEKGGARALVALKKALEAGMNVCMIADIPHGKPRDAGMGVILLARASGRPIVGAAIATSRRRVLEKSWDKTTLSLPFGRRAVVTSEPIYVPGDADDSLMEQKRRELTLALNDATARAYALVDARQ